MFWSKIWFFLIACAAAAALTVALVMPRPAERERKVEERQSLAVACDVINILLRDNARGRLDLAGKFARAEGVDSVLREASKEEDISADTNQKARKLSLELLEEIRGAKPDFAILTDASGRVVARAGIQDKEFGDTVAGYYAVDDALDGYLRDDLWHVGKKLYLVATSPVVDRVRDAYVGAVVLGHQVDKELAEELIKPLNVDIAFFSGGSSVAASKSVGIENEIRDEFESLRGSDTDRSEDCRTHEPLSVNAGDKRYMATLARLPGEAGESGAFYSVYLERAEAVGFGGTLDAVTKGDLGFGTFPWIPLGAAFLVIVAGGIVLMVFEADLPLRRLNKEAITLAKGDAERLEEERHRGKYGSIARSVNIYIDKIKREAKTARKDLDQLLGPAPGDSGPIRTPAPSPLPAASPSQGPGTLGNEPFRPPPPSEFRFSDGGAPGGGNKPVPATAAPAPSQPYDLDLPPPPSSSVPPAPAVNQQVPPPPVSLPGGQGTPPPGKASAKSRRNAIDDDILASPGAAPPAPPPIPSKLKSKPKPQAAPAPRPPSDFDAPTRVADPSRALLDQSSPPVAGDDADDEESYFRRVYDDFIAKKEECGESTTSLTFEKFAGKLRKNRDALMRKHECQQVRFQVYVKDGKAALKATPVKG